ncbi:hypothetical protein, partial [Escherichia coli]|uniref:hypothetical protein n=1 Tax=Escherichia coli TaxID=562 RepID=UPI002010A6DE
WRLVTNPNPLQQPAAMGKNRRQRYHNLPLAMMCLWAVTQSAIQNLRKSKCQKCGIMAAT